MTINKINLFVLTISTVLFSQMSVADDSIYTITKSEQGSSLLFEKQISDSINTDLPLFKRQLVINNDGETEYHYVPIVKENTNKQWIEAKNKYSKTSTEAMSICSRLTTLDKKWHSPTPQEFNNAMNNWDPEFISLMNELSGTTNVSGILNNGEWYYISSTHQGHAVNKNNASSYEPKPTICIID
ncbi:hypothetical protein [Photobacterium damselae]|uniref:hypothetical protein n=1 Tax=Photobacterium damselae TaxID=38293 RepID=UPI00406970A4